jgi:hypothetical protein
MKENGALSLADTVVDVNQDYYANAKDYGKLVEETQPWLTKFQTYFFKENLLFSNIIIFNERF